jgi:BirA family biotin operon repressor/biotin-[acetyl-CoA-carboxylase] ligase
MTEPTPTQPVNWTVPTRQLGRRVLVYPKLDSTNSLALSFGNDPANHGLVLLAHEQTAGRGQHGRSWQAPPGSSVLMTVLLFPPPHLCRPAVLTAWAAVAVSELLLEITSRQARIKWPNDVYLDGKKVCGILIEQRSGGGDQAPATAVGIGLNVCQPAAFFEQAGLTLGGSIFSVTGADLDHRDVARRLIERLDRDYDPLANSDFAALESAWKARLGVVDQSVRIETLTGRHQGHLIDVTLEGLAIDIGGEVPLLLPPESVRHIESVAP